MNKLSRVIACGFLSSLTCNVFAQDMSDHDMSKMQMPTHEAMDHSAHAEHQAHMQNNPATGAQGDPANVDRTIDITMDDSMRFKPSTTNVKAGETIRFFVKNTGKLTHEMMIGSPKELKEHAEMMRNMASMPNMHHEMSNMLSLAPGKIGGLIWKFANAGVVDFACLIPGHMEAGMKGTIHVTANVAANAATQESINQPDRDEGHNNHHEQKKAESAEHYH